MQKIYLTTFKPEEMEAAAAFKKTSQKKSTNTGNMEEIYSIEVNIAEPHHGDAPDFKPPLEEDVFLNKKGIEGKTHDKMALSGDRKKAWESFKLFKNPILNYSFQSNELKF